MTEEKFKFVAVKESTHKFLLMEKHKRSIESSKTITFDALIKELLGLKK